MGGRLSRCRTEGIFRRGEEGLEGLSRADVHAVEQTLIDFHCLEKMAACSSTKSIPSPRLRTRSTMNTG